MSRAYLRLDPSFDEHKYRYPDGAYRALIATFCLAETQSTRGHFRDLAYLRGLLGRCGRWARYLLDHGDLVLLTDGRVYVDGWAEWQEGDHTVGERVARIRNRLHHVTAAVTADVTPAATADVTPAPGSCNGLPLKPVAEAEALSVSVSSSTAPSAVPAREVRATSHNGSHELDLRDTLTLRQRDAWATFDRQWDEFKTAWIGRGLHHPPSGEPDEEGSQRALLYEILIARPHEMVAWVREAKGKTARAVVGHVLERWGQIKADVGAESDEFGVLAPVASDARSLALVVASIGDLLAASYTSEPKQGARSLSDTNFDAGMVGDPDWIAGGGA